MNNNGVKECFPSLNDSVQGGINTYLNPNQENNNFYFSIELFSIGDVFSFPLSLIYYLKEDNNNPKTYLNEMFPRGMRLSLYKRFEKYTDEIIVIDPDGRKRHFDIIDDSGLFHSSNEIAYVDYCLIEGTSTYQYIVHESEFVVYYYRSNENYPYKMDDLLHPELSFTSNIVNGKLSYILFNSNYYRLSFAYSNGYVSFLALYRYDSNDGYVQTESIEVNYYSSNSHISIQKAHAHYAFTNPPSDEHATYASLSIEFDENNKNILLSNTTIDHSLVYHFDNYNRCSYFYKRKGNINSTGLRRCSLTYNGLITSYTDENGDDYDIRFDKDYLPIFTIINSDFVKTYNYNHSLRQLIYSSPTMYIGEDNRIQRNLSITIEEVFKPEDAFIILLAVRGEDCSPSFQNEERAVIKIHLRDYNASVIATKVVKSSFFSIDHVMEYISIPINTFKTVCSIYITVQGEQDSSWSIMYSPKVIHDDNYQEIEIGENLYNYCRTIGKNNALSIKDEKGRSLIEASNGGSNIYRGYSLNNNDIKPQTIYSDFDVTTSYTYDSLQRKTFESSLFESKLFTYDNYRLIGEMSNGVSISYTYNSRNRITSTSFDNDYLKTNYTFRNYDNGLLSGISHSGNNVIFDSYTLSYNNKLINTGVTNYNSLFAFTFDDALRNTSDSINNTSLIGYTYNSEEQISSKRYSVGSYFYFNYDNENRLSSITYGNSIIHTFTYDDLNRLEEIDDYSFIYDDGNNIISTSISNFVINNLEDGSSYNNGSYQYPDSSDFYLLYTSSNQSHYLSKQTILSSLYAHLDVSFVTFTDFYNYMTIVDRLLMRGFKEISIVYDEDKDINYDNYYFQSHRAVINFGGVHNDNIISYQTPNMYYPNERSGGAIGGLFYFNTLPNNDNGPFGVLHCHTHFYSSIEKDIYIKLQIKNNKYYLVCDYLKVPSSSDPHDEIEIAPFSANTWVYLSLNVIFKNNKFHEVKIRINEDVYSFKEPNDLYSGFNIDSTSIIYNNYTFLNYGNKGTGAYSWFLFIGNNGHYLEDDEEREIYLGAQSYYFDDEEETTHSSSLYYDDLLNYDENIIDFIPLNNSFATLRGQNPIIGAHDYSLNYFANSSFRFVSNRYRYYANGMPLTYDFDFTNDQGSVSFNYRLDSVVTTQKRYFLEISFDKTIGGRNIEIYIDGSELKVVGNQTTFLTITNLIYESDDNFVFRWQYYGATHTLTLIVKINNTTYTASTGFPENPGDGYLSIGAKFDYPSVMGSELKGYIDSVVIYNRNSPDPSHDVELKAIKSHTDVDVSNGNSVSKSLYLGNNVLSTFLQDTSKPYSDTYHRFLAKGDSLRFGNYEMCTNQYLYDSYGRLISETFTVKTPYNQIILTKTISYTYDSFSRLSSYYDSSNNKTVSYTYDSHGNILEEETIINNNSSSKTFTYDNLNRMTSINGISTTIIPYQNEIIQYLDNSFIFQGKRLMSISLTNQNNNNTSPFVASSFDYDYRSRRTYRLCDNKEYRYFYDDNDNMIYEEIYNSSNHTLIHNIRYYYDENGRLSFLCYDHTSYYYYYIDSFNIVRGLYDAYGNMVVTYFYDPWGNVLSVNDVSNISLSTLNVYLYKCYQYDHENKMYYCLSRYYVPSWMRWLSQDDFSYLDYSIPNGYNLYIYCGNNPVNYDDKEGNSFITALLTTLCIVGVLSIFAANIVLTIEDVDHILNNDLIITKTDTGVEIKDSYLIRTPWVKAIYLFYLKYVNYETIGYLSGSIIGLEYEWFLHNFAHFFTNSDQAADVNFGHSIFSDFGHGCLGLGMKVSYMIHFHIAIWLFDLIVAGGWGHDF